MTGSEGAFQQQPRFGCRAEVQLAASTCTILSTSLFARASLARPLSAALPQLNPSGFVQG